MNQASAELRQTFSSSVVQLHSWIKTGKDRKASVIPARTALDPFAVLEILTSWQVHDRLSECAF
jgi:hypothetical protein